MNQIANVLYAYSPKNDDELELTVGDKIEVIGYEEEGKCFSGDKMGRRRPLRTARYLQTLFKWDTRRLCRD